MRESYGRVSSFTLLGVWLRLTNMRFNFTHVKHQQIARVMYKKTLASMESNKKLKVKSFAGGGVYVFPNDGSESASSALPILKTKSALAGWHILTDRQ